MENRKADKTEQLANIPAQAVNSRTFVSPDQNAMRDEYEKYTETRQLIVNDVKSRVEQILVMFNSRPVISGRIKNFSSYYSKYIRLLRSNNEDLKITDLMGVRIICPFIEDLNACEELIKINFDLIEREIKGHFTFKEFGYESTHLLIKIPQNIIEKRGNPGTDILEIQIRTILQDAWAEVEHELVYKAELNPFDEPMKRKLAAVNASLTLADIIFQEIRSYQRKYTKEMGKRRESFYQKIEESTDVLLFSEEQEQRTLPPVFDIDNLDSPSTKNNSQLNDSVSIDDLLVQALSAHNLNNFSEAINLYTNILKFKPKQTICAIIFKHRGMAHFACSQYNEAIEDFCLALELDDKSYKAAYYCGVVRSVLKQYSQAIDDYTHSLSINPYQSFCLFRRGQAYYHIGDYPQALSDCEDSLLLEPGNKAAIKFKELLIEKLKNIDLV
ncbi:MAG: tetratricopeptide repeat protein [Treponema sp.]|nr:tetratricopeptide repeat protein [Treponema sp.]